MHGSTHAYPSGVINELLNTAEEKGSLTPPEIATILDVDELPVAYEVSRSVERDG